jgi:hypothetical protein
VTSVLPTVVVFAVLRCGLMCCVVAAVCRPLFACLLVLRCGLGVLCRSAAYADRWCVLARAALWRYGCAALPEGGAGGRFAGCASFSIAA